MIGPHTSKSIGASIEAAARVSAAPSLDEDVGMRMLPDPLLEEDVGKGIAPSLDEDVGMRMLPDPLLEEDVGKGILSDALALINI
mgnify:CR=1 FL=1